MNFYVWVLLIGSLVIFAVLFFGIATISRRNHIQRKNLMEYAPRRRKGSVD